MVPIVRDVHIDAEVRNSFHRGSWNFVSINAGDFISCPPYVVASVARSRLTPGTQLDLPQDYNDAVLDDIRSRTSWSDQEVPVSFYEAAELAIIGTQLQDLNDEGKVQPPLGYFEKQSICHLLKEVGTLELGDMIDAGLSYEDIAHIALTQVTIGRGRG